MNAGLPEYVDAWRMVQARSTFQGTLPLQAMARLRESLASAEGAVGVQIDFGRDDSGVARLRVRADAELPLVCQRTLEPFILPVHVDVRLGLIATEQDEASLPAGYEPLLAEPGKLRLADVVEDELILALPVVPVKPGTSPVTPDWNTTEQVQDNVAPKPFDVLRTIKASRS